MATPISPRAGNRSILSCLHSEQSTTKKSVRSHDEIKSTEAFLASEMNRLTVQERLVASNDVHSAGEEPRETPEMIQKSLSEFDRAIRNERNPIYMMAASQNSSYVEDPSFRLKFLRANMHNIGQSVRQMMNFLRHKATYFGSDKIARDITLDDLNEEEMELMLSGLFHIQDGRDRTGRAALCYLNTMNLECKVETWIRVAYFVYFNVLIPLPEVQTKGLVGVYLDAAKPGEKIKIPGFKFMLTSMNFMVSLPVRISALHVCLQAEKGKLALNNTIVGIAMNAFPQYVRVRSRIHCGSSLELRYQLKNYGLPIGTFPVDTNGNIRKDILNAWFQKHCSSKGLTKNLPDPAILQEDIWDIPAFSDMEELDAFFSGSDGKIVADSGTQPQLVPSEHTMRNNEPSSFPIDGDVQQEERKITIIEPTKSDVLLGRGRDIQSHEGNVQFRKFLEDYSDGYDSAPRNKRRKIVVEVSQTLSTKGVRFLEQTDGNKWIESDSKEAERKIGQLFRSLRKKK